VLSGHHFVALDGLSAGVARQAGSAPPAWVGGLSTAPDEAATDNRPQPAGANYKEKSAARSGDDR
jgi:hypothetical protein